MKQLMHLYSVHARDDFHLIKTAIEDSIQVNEGFQPDSANMIDLINSTRSSSEVMQYRNKIR